MSTVAPQFLIDSPQRVVPQLLLVVAATLAVALPALLAYNVSPSATFLNQAAALVGWGGFVALLAIELPNSAQMPRNAGLFALFAAMLLMLLAAILSAFWAGLPAGLAISSVGLIAAALVVLSMGVALVRAGHGERAFRAFCIALGLAGFLSLIVESVQNFAPQWADGDWIAHASTPGRAGGNLRQPNHLSSLLLWSAVALIWLYETSHSRALLSQGLRRAGTMVFMCALMWGVVLTVSRTGTVCVVLLALWGILDKHLSRFSRVLLCLTPLIYLLCWVGMTEWADTGAHAFAGASQMHRSDPSSSRFGIWSNTLTLIAQHPWAGVGWGEFNFAWTLTPFPGRPVAFFDHAHNLPLHLLAELGIPLGGLVLVLLAWAFGSAFVAGARAPASMSVTTRSAFMMVLMMAVHSQLEYPLWYAYFLLPTAFAFGIVLGQPKGAVKAGRNGPWAHGMLLGGCALAVGGLLSISDYRSVVSIFTPPPNATSLAERIAQGQRSWFFSHHADYAAATTAEHPSQVMQAFERAPHFLLDARLMMAWARALAESGDIARASYVAQRLREFDNEQSTEFFDVCNVTQPGTQTRSYQCEQPQAGLSFRDFR